MRQFTFNDPHAPSAGRSCGIAANRPANGSTAETGLYHDDGTGQPSAARYRSQLTGLALSASPCPAQPRDCADRCGHHAKEALLRGPTAGAAARAGSPLRAGPLRAGPARVWPHQQCIGQGL